MQLIRLAATAKELNRALFSAGRSGVVAQRYGYANTTGRTADPATHAVDPEEVGAAEAEKDEKLRHAPENPSTTQQGDGYIPPKSPLGSSPKLQSTGIGQQTDPFIHQKRRNFASSAEKLDLDNITCTAPLDSTEWPDDHDLDRRQQRDEQMEDDREYFKDHKASPLSEMEMADTRKPITQATDGTAQNDAFGYTTGDVLLWRPEQLDSAEDSLRRAMEMFRQNAMRGDPESPHGRRLRELRGEYW